MSPRPIHACGRCGGEGAHGHRLGCPQAPTVRAPTPPQAKPYACFDRPALAPIVRMQDGWTEDGRRNMVEHPFRNNPDCQYTHTTLGQLDARCVSCKHRSTLVGATHA